MATDVALRQRTELRLGDVTLDNLPPSRLGEWVVVRVVHIVRPKSPRSRQGVTRSPQCSLTAACCRVLRLALRDSLLQFAQLLDLKALLPLLIQ